MYPSGKGLGHSSDHRDKNIPLIFTFVFLSPTPNSFSVFYLKGEFVELTLFQILLLIIGIKSGEILCHLPCYESIAVWVNLSFVCSTSASFNVSTLGVTLPPLFI